MTPFDRSMAFVLRWEGGKVDNPADPGGRTNQGVTQRVYSLWRMRLHISDRDVYEMTDDERDAIYREQYWKAASCDRLAWPLCLVQFDTAVNCGCSRALHWLQESNGDLVAYLVLRRAHYARLIENHPKLAIFRHGWERRMDALEKECV
jgi:lysozyme family protein